MACLKTMASLSLISFVIFICVISEVSGHGRLLDPPSRSSMWRAGFQTTRNYDDHQLYCGGYKVQFYRNGGRCGVCGDPWDSPTPRPNEAGGTYGRGIIVRNYKPGQIIQTHIDLTVHHRGFFEFRLCPHNNPSRVVSQSCLDRYVLQRADGSGKRYYPSGTGSFYINLKLPDHLTCSQCVFQWIYTAGNSWGDCGNGISKLGCGPQENFRGCADVAIQGNRNVIPSYNSIPVKKTPSRSSYGSRGGGCRAVSAWQSNSGMNDWCVNNCARGNCPSSHCTCS